MNVLDTSDPAVNNIVGPAMRLVVDPVVWFSPPLLVAVMLDTGHHTAKRAHDGGEFLPLHPGLPPILLLQPAQSRHPTLVVLTPHDQNGVAVLHNA